MRQRDSNKMNLVVAGIVAAMILGGGNLRADFTFGTPQNMGPQVNTETNEFSGIISADGLEFYFHSNRDGGIGGWDIWICTRATTDDEWGESENLGELVNSDVEDANPTLSSNGLELYFNSFRSDGLGGTDLWVTKRATRSDPWEPPENLGPLVNSEKGQSAPSISGDGLELYFKYGDADLPDDDPVQGFYVTRRETKDAPWGEPVSLGPVVNSWPNQREVDISSDGLFLFWADYWNGDPRPGGFGDQDLWYSRRATKGGEWGEPVNFGPAINTLFAECSPAISADGSMLYFASNHCGTLGRSDIWQAPILPVVDFDDDGCVGISDLLMLVEAWETNNPKCDIGPMPWGDGIVDAADLDVLMDHWGQEVGLASVELVAHWAFDETEGMKAYDSAGIYDANLMGDPVWQPSGGMVGGAIELDGMDDYVSAPYIFPPSSDSFSLFAWVKGGAPNEVIACDSGLYGFFFLQADFKAGNLMTTYNSGVDDYLFSQTPITDGQWHHVGLVWDGYPAKRVLYVDGFEVAADTVTNCTGMGDDWRSANDIYIGASWGLDNHRNCYWSGLIDDVRIYEGALSAEEIAALAQ